MKIPDWTTMEKVGICKYKIIEIATNLGKKDKAINEAEEIKHYCDYLIKVLKSG